MTTHEAWVPKAYGFLDRPSFYRPNLHNEKTEGAELPWVVPRNRNISGSRPGSHTEQHWTRLRPRNDALGPRSLSCRSVEPFKFYLMVEAMVPSCNLKFNGGKELVDLMDAKGGTKGTGQHLGELFFFWHLRNHTWRTFDPMEAQLVVVPIFGTLLSRGVCGPLDPALAHIATALEAFPRFKLNQGKDFMMMATDYKPQAKLFAGPFGEGKKLFRGATRNFIYASRLNGKFIRLRHVQGKSRCVLPVPYTSAHEVEECKGDQDSGLLSCPGLQDNEDTFEEFMANRNTTLFFMGQVALLSNPPSPLPFCLTLYLPVLSRDLWGLQDPVICKPGCILSCLRSPSPSPPLPLPPLCSQADNRVAYQSRRDLVTQVAFLSFRRSPGQNYVVGSVASNRMPPPRPVCSRSQGAMNWNGCFFRNNNHDIYQMKLAGCGAAGPPLIPSHAAASSSASGPFADLSPR